MDSIADLADLIDACMEGDDEIDHGYLLEAVVDDLRALANGGDATAVANLIENPVS